MKTNIIEIGLPTDNIPRVQPTLEENLRETGGLLIGRQVYEDQTLLVIQLMNDHALQFHINALSTAFHQKQISSYQIISCHLFKVVFTRDNYQELLEAFPLQVGEAWFEAAEEKRSAYLCLKLPHLSQLQIYWLATETSIIQWTNES
jgi:hypothetical protein